MTSRSEEKRPYAVVPVRSLTDKRLKEEDRRVLTALGYYANRAGVCWPSVRTLKADADVGINTVTNSVARLVEAGYVRQLNPNDYDQKAGTWGHSNRYQILWKGDEPVPTWEEIRDANLLQPHDVRDETTEGSGARGPTDEQRHHMRRLEAAWQAATEAVNGVRLVTPAPTVELLALALAGVDPVALRSTAEAEIRRRTAARLGFPTFQAIAALVLSGGVQDPSGRLTPVHGAAAPSGE